MTENDGNNASDAHDAEDTPRVCSNCGAPLDGAHCKECGQKDVPLRSLGAFMRDAWSEIVGLDSRILRTLRALLFSPGHLTQEYWHGRRTYFVPPTRLYLAVSFLYFSLRFLAPPPDTSLTTTTTPDPTETAQPSLAPPSPSPPITASEEALPQKSHEAWLESIPETELDSILALVDQGDYQAGGAWLKAHMAGRSETEKNQLFNLFVDRQMKYSLEQHEWELSPLERRLLAATGRGIKSVGSSELGPALYGGINSYMPRALFLAMPFMALLLKLVFIRRNRLYVEHLVFSVHTHVTLFLALSLSKLASILVGQEVGWLQGLIGCWILGLTIAGFKRAYDQPWLRCLTTAGAVLGIQAALLILLTLLSANIPILKAGWA